MNFIISRQNGNLLDLVRQAIDEHGFCIVKNFFDCDPLLNIIQTFKEGFSADIDLRRTGPYEYKMPNFQRLDLGDYSQVNARFSRMFTNFTWNKESLFATPIDAMIDFRNQLFSLAPSDHTYNYNGKAFCDLPKVLHYPVGGGFMNKHVDRNKDWFIPNVLMSLTKRGMDFYEGGVYYLDKKGKIVDAEEILEVGDLYMHSVDTFHGVKAVDSKKNIDLTGLNGRLAINLSLEKF